MVLSKLGAGAMGVVLAVYDPELDRKVAHAQAWVAAPVEACEATHRGEQSGELLDLRMACLDERL